MIKQSHEHTERQERARTKSVINKLNDETSSNSNFKSYKKSINSNHEDSK